MLARNEILKKIVEGDEDAYVQYLLTSLTLSDLYNYLCAQQSLATCEPAALKSALEYYVGLPPIAHAPAFLVKLRESNRMKDMNVDLHLQKALIKRALDHQFTSEACEIVKLFYSASQSISDWHAVFFYYGVAYYEGRIKDGRTQGEHDVEACHLLRFAYARGNVVAAHYLALMYLADRVLDENGKNNQHTWGLNLLKIANGEKASEMMRDALEKKALNCIEKELEALAMDENNLFSNNEEEQLIKCDPATHFMICLIREEDIAKRKAEVIFVKELHRYHTNIAPSSSSSSVPLIQSVQGIDWTTIGQFSQSIIRKRVVEDRNQASAVLSENAKIIKKQ